MGVFCIKFVFFMGEVKLGAEKNFVFLGKSEDLSTFCSYTIYCPFVVASIVDRNLGSHLRGCNMVLWPFLCL